MSIAKYIAVCITKSLNGTSYGNQKNTQQATRKFQ